jgi:beta-phosphoglucomutase-like phosphatase (HAD superfamily)
MHAVLLDFNGTLFFDSSLHLEAWSKIYQVLHPDSSAAPDAALFCGPRNEVILQSIAPWLTAAERARYSEEKEELYRTACRTNSQITHLVAGVEDFLEQLQRRGIPCILVSASIEKNIDFFFEIFGLGRWLKREQVVFDDGSYEDKRQMYLEAAHRLQVEISDCLIVEDSPSSVGHAAQLSPGCIVAVGHTAPAAQLLELGAQHYIRDFTEFDFAWLTHRKIP